MILFIDVAKGVSKIRIEKGIKEGLLRAGNGSVRWLLVDTLVREGVRTLVYDIDVRDHVSGVCMTYIEEALGSSSTFVGRDLVVYVEIKGSYGSPITANVEAVAKNIKMLSRGNTNKVVLGNSSSKNGLLTLALVIRNISRDLYAVKNDFILKELKNKDGIKRVYVA